ncbi:cellulase family glycosylhydrolase [Trinickia sp. NRRL B-1857]|uniref:cellulase family glycosylhydrolase n=1 Tax=Trinickia sp. NRRL B-1857 TaxID=3162879 RepID=UPI003D2BDE16
MNSIEPKTSVREKLKLLCLILALACCTNAIADPIEDEEADDTPTPESVVESQAQTINHSLSFDSNPKAATIKTGIKKYKTSKTTYRDKIFRDGTNREVIFRGWNISGMSKLLESKLLPFKSDKDAEASISSMANMAAPNVIRFLISWEAINPSQNIIDYTYLDSAISQMKIAIAHNIYVLLDYHQDVFSRYLFQKDSWYTGNGAPAWVVPNYPNEYCGLVCTSWAQMNLTDEAIRLAARNFWNNAKFTTKINKTDNLQTAFLWQMQQSLTYIKSKLSKDEFAYILGVDPWNEPIDGGMEGLTPKEWENTKLWPFYENAKKTLDEAGWKKKLVFAEPLVFWNSTAGVIAPATGGQLLDKKPGPRYVFNAHFYDAGRQAADFRNVDNASYLFHFDQIRTEARFRHNAAFVSEFGASLNGTGRMDTVRTIHAMYQGLEASDAINGRTRYVDFYSLPLSGTEWQWDHYYDKHAEYQNQNPDKLITKADGWNGENFSVAQGFSSGYNVDAKLVERAYPRKTQGDLMSFYYNDMSQDASNKPLNWAGLRPVVGGTIWLRNSQFVLTVWRGRRSKAPTEIVLPRTWKATDLAVVTDSQLHVGDLVSGAAFTQTANEVDLEPDTISKQANRLLIWDDTTPLHDNKTIHFALAINQDASGDPPLATTDLTKLQTSLIAALCNQKTGVVYMLGTMIDSAYPPE